MLGFFACAHTHRFFTCAHTHWIALGLALALFVGMATSVVLSGRTQEPEPEDSLPVVEDSASDDPFAQPIAFSHAHHVTDVGLHCQMCHVYARRGPVAGIPSVETCAGCHEQVLSDRPEIQKVLEYWKNEEPIPWVRVHDLPDYTRFSHKRHVLGGVDCAECHGNVGQMEAAVQVESLTMGWCVTCHEAREASLDCLTCHY